MNRDQKRSSVYFFCLVLFLGSLILYRQYWNQISQNTGMHASKINLSFLARTHWLISEDCYDEQMNKSGNVCSPNSVNPMHSISRFPSWWSDLLKKKRWTSLKEYGQWKLIFPIPQLSSSLKYKAEVFISLWFISTLLERYFFCPSW